MRKIYFILLLFLSHIFYGQSDCISAINVCGNSNISYFPTGSGDVDDQVDQNGSCLSLNERFSVWYRFTVATSGVLTFVISPEAPYNADYDFAVYGPDKPCSNKGAPIRCNYDGSNPAPNQTGLQIGATNPNGGGTPWSSPLNVIAGETYYLIVSNFSEANALLSFSLSRGGTATLASPFNDPTLQPNPFNPIGIPGPTPNDPRLVELCDITSPFNFHSLSADIINGNPNFYIKYYRTSNDALADTNEIITPIIVNTTDSYFYTIRYTNPNNPDDPVNKCFNVAEFKFIDRSITTQDVTLTECNNNGSGVATYDLTTAQVITPDPTYIYKYYPTLNDANNDTNEITNPSSYTSAEGIVFVKVTTQLGCSDIAKITLKFHPLFTVIDATLRSCYIETNPSTAEFDLTSAVVTAGGGGALTKKYFPSLADAIDVTNEIITPNPFISPNGVVFVRVSNNQGCYMIAKINLVVLGPVKSNVLQDKVICIEDKTTLDAGPGFASYQWSTGETTQSITDVSVGTYWVKLQTGECYTTQKVTVFPAESPVVTGIDIAGTKITVNVAGGMAPYKYSIDKIVWQDSNVFENVNRGEVTVYVKDSYDCTPIEIPVTIPNIINVITPNGDGINDVIDYSSLSMKQNLVFNIYDRYGVQIHRADKSNGYKWNGTIGGQKISTGTYWYSVSWNENDKVKTPVKYSGWIVVKNRE